MKRILIKNSIFGVSQSIINIVLVFLVVPVFIEKLGIELYGVFSLVIVAGNLNTFANLGLTSTLIKFIAEQGKSKESTVDIIVNFFLILITITTLTVVALNFDDYILTKILSVPLQYISSTKHLYFWILIANLILLLGQVFKAILDALQLIYLTSFQQGIYNFLYWGLIFLSLFFELNFKGIGISIFVAASIWFIITFYSAINKWGIKLFLQVEGGYKNSLKKQLKYSAKLYSSGLIGFFYEPVSKILASHFLGVAAVGFYDIALRLKGQIWGLLSKLFYPLFPFISEQKDIKTIKKYVNELEQKTFLFLIPLVVIIIFSTYPFIEFWIGKDVSPITVTVVFIVTFHLLFSTTVIPNYQFLLAKNLAEKTIYIQLSNVFLNVVFFLGTVNFLGYYSIILGNVIAILGSFVLSLYYQKKYLNSLIFNSTLQILKMIFTFIILILVTFVLSKFLGNLQTIFFFMAPIVIFPLALYIYKWLNLVSINDIYRFAGKENIISKLFNLVYK